MAKHMNKQDILDNYDLFNDEELQIPFESILTWNAYDPDNTEERCEIIDYCDRSSHSEMTEKFFWEMLSNVCYVKDNETTACTTHEGMIVFNYPGFIIPKDKDMYRKWYFIHAHECMHQLWDTFEVVDRIKENGIEYDHELLNIASDCVINDYLMYIKKQNKLVPDDLITPESLKKNYNVEYNRKVDTQFTLYKKMLELDKSEREKLKNKYKEKEGSIKPTKTRELPSEGGGPQQKPQKFPTEFIRGWGDARDDVYDKKVDPLTYKPTGKKDYYSQGYDKCMEYIKDLLENGLPVSKNGGGGKTPDNELPKVKVDNSDLDMPKQQGGGGESNNSDSDSNSSDSQKQSQKSAERSKDNAEQAQEYADRAQEAADKAKKSGDSQAANEAQKAADKAQAAADEAKKAADEAESAASNGDTKGAQDAVKKSAKAMSDAAKASVEASEAAQDGASEAQNYAEQAKSAAESAENSAQKNGDASSMDSAAKASKEAAAAQEAADKAADAQKSGDTKAAKDFAKEAKKHAEAAQEAANDIADGTKDSKYCDDAIQRASDMISSMEDMLKEAGKGEQTKESKAAQREIQKNINNAKKALDKAKDAAKTAKDCEAKNDADGKNKAVKDMEKSISDIIDENMKSRAEAHKSGLSKDDSAPSKTTEGNGGQDGAIKPEWLEKAKENRDRIIGKYKSLNGPFGDFLKQCDYSRKLKSEGLAVDSNRGSRAWNKDVDAKCTKYIAQKLKSRKLYKDTYNRVKRGSAPISNSDLKRGQISRKGHMIKKNKIGFNIAIYIDCSGSMSNVVQHVFSAAYDLAEGFKKKFGKIQKVDAENINLKMYAFTTTMIPLPWGKTHRADGGTYSFTKLLEDVHDKEQEAFLNIIITDGDFQSFDNGECARVLKDMEGLFVLVTNNPLSAKGAGRFDSLEKVVKTVAGPNKLSVIYATKDFKVG